MPEMHLTLEQAFEAAYRFVVQYARREPESVSLRLMVGNMEPANTGVGDPATWDDWRRCVAATLAGEPLPSLGE